MMFCLLFQLNSDVIMYLWDNAALTSRIKCFIIYYLSFYPVNDPTGEYCHLNAEHHFKLCFKMLD